MTLFRTSKSSNQLNNLSNQPLEHGDNSMIRISSEGSSALTSFSTYTPAQTNQQHPTHSHHYFHYFSSYSDDVEQNGALTLPHPPQSAPYNSSSHPNTPSTTLNRSRSLLGLKTHYSHKQPHQHKRTFHSRFLTSMGSHEASYPTPIAPSTALAPSTFRLLKSKIFSSAPPKTKPTQSPKLPVASSSLARNVYLFPGSPASLEQMDYLSQTGNSEQKVYLIRQRSKSNNMMNRHQEAEVRNHNQLPSPPSSLASRSGPSVDFARSGPSLDLSRTGHSIDISRSAPSIDVQRVAPTQSNHHPVLTNNRIVMVDLNSNRMNYPSFNNKPAAQNGPRVLRLVGQVSNSPFENQTSQVAGSSHRPTPTPHGGSGAILTLNPIRSAAVQQTLHHPDSQHEPVPARSESLPLNNQQSGSSPTENQNMDFTSPSLETLRIMPSDQSSSPLRSRLSLIQLATLHAKKEVTHDPSPDASADITLRIPSSSSTFVIKNLDTSISTLASNTVVPSKVATSQLASANKSTPPKLNASSNSPASKQSFELDFSEFANFLSYPDLVISKRHSQLVQSELATTRPPSLPSLFSSKLPSTPKSYLSPTTSTGLNQHASSSLPSTPVPLKFPSPSSPSSPRALSSSQPANTQYTPLTPLPPAASTSAALPSPISPMLSPQSSVSSNYSAALSSSPVRPGLFSTTTSHSSSPLSPFAGRTAPPSKQYPPPLPLPLPPSQPSQSEASNLELEKARKIILGLQNEVKQLKDASTESIAVPSESKSSALLSSMPVPEPSKLSDDAEKSEKPKLKSQDNNDENASSSLTVVLAGTTQNPEQSMVKTVSTNTSVPEAPAKDDILNHNSQVQSDDELEQATKPSRLPIAKHRLREVASVAGFGRNLHSRTPSGTSITSRTWKVSLGSNGSTEYRCATSQSHSTYRTTPSPISTSLKPKARQGSLGNPAFPGYSRSQSPQGEETWSRSTQDAIYPDLGESGSQVSRTSGKSSTKGMGRQIARPSHLSRAPSIASHSSSSSSQLARTHLGAPRSRRHNGSLPSIHNDEPYGRDNALIPLSEHSRHRSRRHLNRSGLDSVEEDFVFDEDADESSWSMMTKVELLAMLKSQQSEFAIERQELLGALRQSREKVAQSSREWERLRAEDGWKTEQLNKAREEIGWLSRLADTLEVDKSRLEDRVHSMANELRRVSGSYRKGSTPTSQRGGPIRDVGPLSPSRAPNLTRSAGIANSSARSTDAALLSRSTSRSSYSPRTPSTAVHRASYMSGDSVRTICPKGPSPRVHESEPHGNSPRSINNWRTRESSVDESDVISPGKRQHRPKHRFALAQRSESDFRLPLTTSNLHSPRSEHLESFVSRQRSRPPSSSRSNGFRRNHSEYQQSEGGSSEDGRRADTIIEERDDQVHRGGSNSNYRNRRGFQNSDHSEHEEPSDYQEDYGEHEEPLDYQDVVHELDAHKGHSRNNSSESLAISPSSTVFADHQRNHRSRVSTYRHSHNLSGNPDSRNSLISLQLRPEDELFLENYLDDDEILSDDDF